MNRRLPALIGAAALILVSIPGGSTVTTDSTEVGVQPGVHPSILVEGNGEFQRPSLDNGVRAGNGSASNPYQIEGWVIAQDQPYGIKLVNTTDHVVIEDVAMAGGTFGIQLVNASNVTIRDAVIDQQHTGIRANEVDHLRVQRAIVGHDSPVPAGRGTSFGIDLVDVDDVTVSNASLGLALAPISLRGVHDAVVRDSSFNGGGVASSGSTITLSQVSQVTFARNEFPRISFSATLGMSNFTFAYNDVSAGNNVFVSGFDQPLDWHNFDLCGNTFRNTTGDAVVFRSVSGHTLIRGNEFLGNEDALHVAFSENTTIVRNEIRNSTDRGLVTQSADSVVHNNSIVGNPENSLLNRRINATMNWWGATDGPSGDFNGSGDPVETFVYAPVVHPWLKSPPAVIGPDAVDCGLAQGPAGVKEGPRVSVDVNAGASASLDQTVGPTHAKIHENAKVGSFHAKADQNVKLGPHHVQASVNESVSRSVGPVPPSS